MSLTKTQKRIHPEKLTAELGKPIVIRGGEPDSSRMKEIEADVDQGVLDAAVAAHAWTAEWSADPAWQERHAARTRLRELHGKGWAKLTAAEKVEVQQHALAILAGD